MVSFSNQLFGAINFDFVSWFCFYVRTGTQGFFVVLVIHYIHVVLSLAWY